MCERSHLIDSPPSPRRPALLHHPVQPCRRGGFRPRLLINSIFVPFLCRLSFWSPSFSGTEKPEKREKTRFWKPDHCAGRVGILGAISTPDGPHSFATQTRTWVGGENGVPSRTLLISLSQIDLLGRDFPHLRFYIYRIGQHCLLQY